MRCGGSDNWPHDHGRGSGRAGVRSDLEDTPRVAGQEQLGGLLVQVEIAEVFQGLRRRDHRVAGAKAHLPATGQPFPSIVRPGGTTEAGRSHIAEYGSSVRSPSPRARSEARPCAAGATFCSECSPGLDVLMSWSGAGSRIPRSVRTPAGGGGGPQPRACAAAAARRGPAAAAAHCLSAAEYPANAGPQTWSLFQPGCPLRRPCPEERSQHGGCPWTCWSQARDRLPRSLTGTPLTSTDVRLEKAHSAVLQRRHDPGLGGAH